MTDGNANDRSYSTSASSGAAPSGSSSQPFEPYVAEPRGDDRAQRRGAWLTIFGALSLVVGVLGTCMQGIGAGMSLASDKLMKLGGMDVTPAPKVIQVIGGTQAVILMVLGIVLTLGSILLMMRRPLGATLVRFWAFARLVMVIAGLGAGVFTLKDQAAWQVTLNSEMRESLRKNGLKEEQLPPIPDREKIEAQSLWMLAGASVAFAVWPFVMAIVLTNRANREDIASWGGGSSRETVS